MNIQIDQTNTLVIQQGIFYNFSLRLRLVQLELFSFINSLCNWWKQRKIMDVSNESSIKSGLKYDLVPSEQQ